jgi:hypothetical protein
LQGTPVSSSSKADRHDMTEIMALDTINQQTNQPNIKTTINDFHLESQTIKRTKKYRFGNPGPILGLVQNYGGMKLA